MGKELIIDKDPKSPIAEVFRTLRTNIQFMTANHSLKTLLVTSSVPGEGKSWVSTNLAIAFAGEGKKVILIDSDMRKGRLHTIFDIENKPGLSNYLSGVSELENKDDIFSYIKKASKEGLYVMPAGDVPPNPSELLVSEKMQELITKLKNNFDMVIFDGTPVLLVTDSIILARQLDSTLIVTSYKSTKMGDLEKIKKMIENVGGNISGIVINKIPVTAKKYENTYYYGHHEEQGKNKDVEEKIHEILEEKTQNKEEKTEEILEEKVQDEVENQKEEIKEEAEDKKEEK
jgi:capsular exopolysaccharide synthesis family protein